MKVRLIYFASLRDAAGCEREDIDTDAIDLGALYDTLRARHHFALPRERVRVAVNGDFAAWSRAPSEGDEVVFIPPVSGG